MTEPTNSEMYWLAGLLEADGTFFRSYTGKGTKAYPYIGLEMSDRDVVERAQRIMQSQTIRTPKRTSGYRATNGAKQMFQTHIGGKRAAILMRKLYPLLGERRRLKIETIYSDCGLLLHFTLEGGDE